MIEEEEFEFLIPGHRDEAALVRLFSAALGQPVLPFLEGMEGARLQVVATQSTGTTATLHVPRDAQSPRSFSQLAASLSGLLGCAILFDTAPDDYEFAWEAIFPDGSTVTVPSNEDGEPHWERVCLYF